MENKDFEKRAEYFQHLFGLDNWKIGINYHPQDVPGEKLTGLDLNKAAKTLANPTYNQATITVYPGLLSKPETWDEVLVHEFIHIAMALYDFYTDNMCQEKDQPVLFTARENAVSILTAIIMRMKGSDYNV